MTGPARAAIAVAALGLAACLPPPPPLPSTWEQSPSPSADAVPGHLSPDGFNVAQRMTVRVRNAGCGNVVRGTGFAIDAHTLVTNRHLLEYSNTLEISTYDGRVFDAQATATTTAADLAIVHTDESLPAWAPLAESDPTVADAITIFSYPGGGRLTTTRGVVIASDPAAVDGEVGRAFGTTAKVEGGTSGAPVVNNDGEVVGVIYAGHSELHQSYMVPVSILKELLEQPTVSLPAPPGCPEAA